MNRFGPLAVSKANPSCGFDVLGSPMAYLGETMSDRLPALTEEKPADCDRPPDEADSHSWSVDHAFGGEKPFSTATGRRLTDDQAFAELRRRQLNRNR